MISQPSNAKNCMNNEWIYISKELVHHVLPEHNLVQYVQVVQDSPISLIHMCIT